jgi:hypothetical protein
MTAAGSARQLYWLLKAQPQWWRPPQEIPPQEELAAISNQSPSTLGTILRSQQDEALLSIGHGMIRPLQPERLGATESPRSTAPNRPLGERGHSQFQCTSGWLLHASHRPSRMEGSAKVSNRTRRQISARALHAESPGRYPAMPRSTGLEESSHHASLLTRHHALCRIG